MSFSSEFLLAQANASSEPNVGGAICFLAFVAGAIWLVAIFSKPGRKGFNIHHRGQTTVTPR